MNYYYKIDFGRDYDLDYWTEHAHSFLGQHYNIDSRTVNVIFTAMRAYLPMHVYNGIPSYGVVISEIDNDYCDILGTIISAYKNPEYEQTEPLFLLLDWLIFIQIFGHKCTPGVDDFKDPMIKQHIECHPKCTTKNDISSKPAPVIYDGYNDPYPHYEDDDDSYDPELYSGKTVLKDLGDELTTNEPDSIEMIHYGGPRSDISRTKKAEHDDEVPHHGRYPWGKPENKKEETSLKSLFYALAFLNGLIGPEEREN